MLTVVAGGSFSGYRWLNRTRTATPRSVADSGRSVADSGTLAFIPPAHMRRSAPPPVPRENRYAVVREGICVPSNRPDQEAASRKKWEALLRDPFWQSIFSGVNPESFHLVKTSLPLHRYVTYWKMENGQLIHWTGRQILIPAGTRVFTSMRGDMYLCACGNQVAAVLPPKTPATVLPPEEEPPVAYLVPPEPEPFPAVSHGISGGTPAPPPELVTLPSTLVGVPPIPVGVPPASIETPPALLGGSPPPGKGPDPLPIPGSPGQLAVTPEPDTFSLMLTGLSALIFASRYRKRR